MSYRGCGMIQMSGMCFNGRLGTEDAAISLCCENLDRPKTGYYETAEDTLRAIMGQRALISAECAHCSKDDQRHFSAGCVPCAQFREGNYHSDGKVYYVTLSLYPAPCQSRCIYCSVHKEDQSVDSDTVRAAYEKVFKILELADRCGIVAPNARWQISSGEITIHPYRERIMRFVKGKSTIFFTNCMKFDEDIAQTLHDNPNSAINLSIDAGTPETWKRIKGVDNFDQVTENLTRYYAQSARPGQITLKYIVLPDINDIYEDYQSLMGIAKTLGVKHLTLARDGRKKYNMDQEERTKLTGAAAYLLAMCHKNGITNDMFSYTQEEQAEAIRLAEEILRRGQV